MSAVARERRYGNTSLESEQRGEENSPGYDDPKMASRVASSAGVLKGKKNEIEILSAKGRSLE